MYLLRLLSKDVLRAVAEYDFEMAFAQERLVFRCWLLNYLVIDHHLFLHGVSHDIWMQ
jgi:hypothetical protein